MSSAHALYAAGAAAQEQARALARIVTRAGRDGAFRVALLADPCEAPNVPGPSAKALLMVAGAMLTCGQ